ncbi:MAG TPA: hypothetical protein VG435_18930 [Acidimicrobiales bacterium]|jgi:hypothetical protein|nr:hypothetical protein [Acidimicrobiales bacterium]
MSNLSTGQAVAGAAKEKADELSSVAGEQASQVRSTATDQARQLADQTKSQAKNVLDEATGSVRRQGESQAQQLADGLERLRDQGRALLDGRPEDAPALVGRGHAAVDQVDALAQRLRTGGLTGAAQDLQRFARRRPGTFLLGAGVAGFAVGRLLRTNRDTSGADGTSGAIGTGTPELPWPTAAPSVADYGTSEPVHPSLRPAVPDVPATPAPTDPTLVAGVPGTQPGQVGGVDPTIPVPTGDFSPPPPPAPRPSDDRDF